MDISSWAYYRQALKTIRIIKWKYQYYYSTFDFSEIIDLYFGKSNANQVWRNCKKIGKINFRV